MPPVSINFPVLIHKVHRGSEAAQPLVVYGGGGLIADFSSVEFPGNLAACETCHLKGSYVLPLPAGIHPTFIQDFQSILPNRAICTSCHDNPEMNGHAELSTTSAGIETCLTCHGPGKQFDVATSHH